MTDTVSTAETPDPVKRRWSATRVAKALTDGSRTQDKLIRRGTAATGATGLIIFVVQSVLTTYQAEGKAWREAAMKQAEITVAAVDRSTQATQELRTVMASQIEVVRSMTYATDRMATVLGSKEPPLKHRRTEPRTVGPASRAPTIKPTVP
jgi:hypothetical protein